jgi:hypothetical protein
MATTETLSSAARSELRGITGEIIGPEDSGYDEARKVHNGMIDRSPGVVIRAASADDVAAGVGFARTTSRSRSAAAATAPPASARSTTAW